MNRKGIEYCRIWRKKGSHNFIEEIYLEPSLEDKWDSDLQRKKKNPF